MVGVKFGTQELSLIPTKIMQRTYSNKLSAVDFLKRSLSFISLNATDQQEQNESENRRRLYTSFGKSKSQLRPRPYYCPRSKELAIKDGFVWTQILPHLKKEWQLRYLLLFNEKLCYLKEPVRRSSREMEWREVGITDIVSVKIPGDHQTHMTGDLDQSNMLYLKVNSKTSPTKILLRFKSRQERDEWMTAFLTAKSWSLLNDRNPESISADDI